MFNELKLQFIKLLHSNIKQHYYKLFNLNNNYSFYCFIKCFLYNSFYFIKDCKFLSDIKQNT